MPQRAITSNRVAPLQVRMRLVNQNWWFTTLLVNQHKYCPPLTRDIKCDVVIVGGGFLTPDSELELHQLCRRYGNQAAREIWDAPCSAIDGLVRNIEKYDIACGLLKQD